MARLEDIPQPTRDAVLNLACPAYETTPFVPGPPLSERRIAILTSAALIRRGDKPFTEKPRPSALDSRRHSSSTANADESN